MLGRQLWLVDGAKGRKGRGGPQGFWKEFCFCWWPFVPGEEKQAAGHRVLHSV